jgi:HAD superfamily hydrolase (TIGR01509 family)
MLKAISLDFWDTLYDGTVSYERKEFRHTSLRPLLAAFGRDLPDEEIAALDRAAGRETERWWYEEARGYTGADRLRWMLSTIGIERPTDCPHIAEVVTAVDAALLEHRPALLAGAVDCVRALSSRWPLAIVSDTGFASGVAQDRLLAADGLLDHFAVRVYSCDVGHAKPRPEPFLAAARALDLDPSEILHVGDNERTDVRGALAVGMRAVRLDQVRSSGASVGEFVATDLGALVEYLFSATCDLRPAT